MFDLHTWCVFPEVLLKRSVITQPEEVLPHSFIVWLRRVWSRCLQVVFHSPYWCQTKNNTWRHTSLWMRLVRILANLHHLHTCGHVTVRLVQDRISGQCIILYIMSWAWSCSQTSRSLISMIIINRFSQTKLKPELMNRYSRKEETHTISFLYDKEFFTGIK